MKLKRIYECILAAAAVVGAFAACGGGSSSTTATPDAGSSCDGGTTCGSVCTDTGTDAKNCGSCGHACGASEVCVAGSCSLTCGGGTTKCGTRCVDQQIDPSNCGACGTTCGQGEVCSNGACSSECSAGLVRCGTTCADPATSSTHCGATDGCGDGSGSAGVECPAGQVCAGGTCAAACLAGQILCNDKCVDPLTDRAFCGATTGCDASAGSAGQVCPSGQVCTGGSCEASCLAGQILCANKCVDPLYDPVFCGATDGCGVNSTGSAGQACSSGQVCTSGSCQASCLTGQVLCSNKCVDPLTDPTFCGATEGCGVNNDGSAGQPCASGQVCASGRCQGSCLAGQILCGNKCVDPLNDPTFCGATDGCGTNSTGSAGQTCGSGTVCSSGSCQATCLPGQILCGNKCIDPLSDPTYCGATDGCGVNSTGSAGQSCGSGTMCASGSCQTSCLPGQIACGGKCIDPLTDPTFCGATNGCGVTGGSAGTTCATGMVCTAAGCQASCLPGQILCGGKCIDPVTDRAFCGATAGCGVTGGSAGTTCASGQVCTGSNCQASCLTGQILCGTKCVDPLTDRAYCGATAGCGVTGGVAGTTCASGQVCSGGGCQGSCLAGQILCGTKCVDPLTDSGNCGATAGCGVTGGSGGTTCSSSQKCVSGGCVISCAAGQIVCAGKCVDPLTDSTYCGATTGCGVSGGSAGKTCATSRPCVAGTCSQTATIPITQPMMVGTAYGCGNTPPEYSGAPCGTGVPGFQWNDTAGVVPATITIVVDAFWNCNAAATTPRNVLLNGTVVGTILPGGACVCQPGHVERTVTFSTLTPFVVSGTNTVTFPAISATNCEAYGANPAWGNVYGFINLTY